MERRGWHLFFPTNCCMYLRPFITKPVVRLLPAGEQHYLHCIFRSESGKLEPDFLARRT